MFRIWDNKQQCWLRGDYYLSQNGDLLSSDKKMFGTEKLSLMSEARYVWQQDTGYDDKNGRRIYEGDICRIEISNGAAVCVVAYIPSRAAYMLLDNNKSEFYGFYNEARDKIEIVGNVFDDQNLAVFEEIEKDTRKE